MDNSTSSLRYGIYIARALLGEQALERREAAALRQLARAVGKVAKRSVRPARCFQRPIASQARIEGRRHVATASGDGAYGRATVARE
jgi:hypothetical protein